jgi:tripeptidyl-peptidase-1
VSVSSCGYYASWPASSPYVTAIGATMNGYELTGTPEIACSALTGAIITSGGGFSNAFAGPEYQYSAVSSYFSKYNPSQSGNKPFIKTNRGYPDLSMPGSSYGQ